MPQSFDANPLSPLLCSALTPAGSWCLRYSHSTNINFKSTLPPSLSPGPVPTRLSWWREWLAYIGPKMGTLQTDPTDLLTASRGHHFPSVTASEPTLPSVITVFGSTGTNESFSPPSSSPMVFTFARICDGPRS